MTENLSTSASAVLCYILLPHIHFFGLICDDQRLVCKSTFILEPELWAGRGAQMEGRSLGVSERHLRPAWWTFHPPLGPWASSPACHTASGALSVSVHTFSWRSLKRRLGKKRQQLNEMEVEQFGDIMLNLRYGEILEPWETWSYR